MQITLYTNRCPCCEVLEAALKAASLDFEAVTDTGQMLSMGMTHLPMLSVDGTMMNYSGFDTAEPFAAMLPLLDYLKLGPYDERLGGLDSPATNQRFYRVGQGK